MKTLIFDCDGVLSDTEREELLASLRQAEARVKAGEGIDYALESGAIAAQHLLEAFARGFAPGWLPAYDHLLRDRFEKIFRFSEWIRDWYCKPPLLNLLVPLANRRPELRRPPKALRLGWRSTAARRRRTPIAGSWSAWSATGQSASPTVRRVSQRRCSSGRYQSDASAAGM